MDAFYIEFRALKPFHQLYNETCNMGKAAEFRRQHLAPKIKKSYNPSVDLSEKDFELDPLPRNQSYFVIGKTLENFAVLLLLLSNRYIAYLLGIFSIGIRLGFFDKSWCPYIIQTVKQIIKQTCLIACLFGILIWKKIWKKLWLLFK